MYKVVKVRADIHERQTLKYLFVKGGYWVIVTINLKYLSTMEG